MPRTTSTSGNFVCSMVSMLDRLSSSPPDLMKLFLDSVCARGAILEQSYRVGERLGWYGGLARDGGLVPLATS